jgi:hypothetical protein
MTPAPLNGIGVPFHVPRQSPSAKRIGDALERLTLKRSWANRMNPVFRIAVINDEISLDVGHASEVAAMAERSEVKVEPVSRVLATSRRRMAEDQGSHLGRSE